MLLTLIAFVAVLSILVFVHEFGHFWTAKKLGLIPEEFGFGFPPRAAGIYKDKKCAFKSDEDGHHRCPQEDGRENRG